MTLTWRPMLAADIAPAHALSEIIHPGYPEDRAVFVERQRLYPAGCFVLAGDDGLNGYALSHPYMQDRVPALNMLLGALPARRDTYYLHDIALLPAARGGGAGDAIVSILKEQARATGFDTISLVAVNDSGPFWQRHGFAARNVEALAEKLASYGRGTLYMRGGA